MSARLSPAQSALSSLPVCPCPADAPTGVFLVRRGVRKGHAFTAIEEDRPCLEMAIIDGSVLRCAVGHETDPTPEERKDSEGACSAYLRRTKQRHMMAHEITEDEHVETVH